MSKNLLVLDPEVLRPEVEGKQIDELAKAGLLKLFPDKPDLGKQLFGEKTVVLKNGTSYKAPFMKSPSRMVKDYHLVNGKSPKENSVEAKFIINTMIQERWGKYLHIICELLGYRHVAKGGTIKGEVNLGMRPVSMDSTSYKAFDKEGLATRAIEMANTKEDGKQSLRNLLGTGALTPEAEAIVIREIEAEKVAEKK
jgi:hypothetical protein